MMHSTKPEPQEDRKPDSKELYIEDVVRVMSFNILSDDNPLHPWSNRKKAVESMIRFHRADIVGLQEPSFGQINDLQDALPEFESFDGIFNPIFFRKSRFESLASGSFFNPSSTDAKFPRATSWVQLYDKKLDRKFFFFNTHFDYHGREARNRSAELLTSKVFEIAGNDPFVITGDFNLFPELGGDETYLLLTEKFQDALSSSHFPHHGPTGSWSGFKEAGQPGIKPDCIFVGPQVKVFLHGILSDTFDGQFPSDHLPVVADISF